MTTGIYALYWAEQDLIYVGKSTNIERRFVQHLNNLSLDKHSNYKVQKAYTAYGVPSKYILEVCSTLELDDKEISWTSELSALDSNVGLCIVSPEVGDYNKTNTKYSKLTILKIFRKLYLTLNSQRITQIAKELKVPTHLVEQIKAGVSHLWLRDRFPMQYQKMVSKPYLFIGDTSKYENNPFSIISPEGICYSVTNCKKFAREFNLDPGALVKVHKGERSHHKGWHK